MKNTTILHVQHFHKFTRSKSLRIPNITSKTLPYRVYLGKGLRFWKLRCVFNIGTSKLFLRDFWDSCEILKILCHHIYHFAKNMASSKKVCLFVCHFERFLSFFTFWARFLKKIWFILRCKHFWRIFLTLFLFEINRILRIIRGVMGYLSKNKKWLPVSVFV